MAVTRRGVYHNLKESEYAISNNEVAFFFSSKFYLNKFMVEYKGFRKEFRERVDKTFFKHPLNTDFIADIHCYKEIEKRGFRVVYKGGNIGWEELHRLELEKRTRKNIIDWHVIQSLKLRE